ncbi:MAG: hypothetical protein A2176_08380 [Spirochaetes bacterium RBG_13_51_14]|nr:MAG: hypothetical protein A2176_08380 [Spirochaetes bacterium RBG_13_51_14]
MDTSRTELLVGADGIRKMADSCIAIYGLGGVGGYAAEAIARAGVRNMVIVDHDRVAPSDMNRQILALHSTIDAPKVEAAERRIKDINPAVLVRAYRLRIDPDDIAAAIPAGITHAIDAIDDINAKVSLIAALLERGIRFVSSMGAGSKLDPAGVMVSDISTTRHCPLARTVRRRLKKLGIVTGVWCVYSEENLKLFSKIDGMDTGRHIIQGTVSYMPGIFGLTAAGVIIRDILGMD